MTGFAVRTREESRLTAPAVLAAVLIAAAAAWVVLVGRMAGMDSGPGGDPGALGWFAGSWAAMTAAMMLPASMPAVLRVVRGRTAGAGAVFLVGYGLVWMLAGLFGYSLVEAVRGVHAGALAWSEAGRYVAGASVAAAGLYQLTATKRRWLARCTAPERPLRRDGAARVLRAGVEHGCCCVACCWALMIALYALGMMNLTWMALVTVLIVSERLRPRSRLVLGAVGAVLVVAGVALAL